MQPGGNTDPGETPEMGLARENSVSMTITSYSKLSGGSRQWS
ncbi:hypothetical protein [Rhizobium setariae]|nr:hypothetical protein [Rhizobium setariae]